MKYGFIGCGNMGSAVAFALSKVTTDFAVTDRTGKAKSIAESIGCDVVACVGSKFVLYRESEKKKRIELP